MRRIASVAIAALLLMMIVACGGSSSGGSSGTPNPGGGATQFAYVAGGTAVNGFQLSGNALTAAPGSPFAGSANSITTDTHNAIYTSDGTANITSWAINADGSLTRTNNFTAPLLPGGQEAPGPVSVDPTGTQLYSQILGPNAGLQAFNIGANGVLTPAAFSPSVAAHRPTFSSDGRFAFVPFAFQLDSGVSTFTHTPPPSDGSLIRVNEFFFAVPENPGDARLSPNGQLLAVPITAGLALFTVNANGSLTLIGTPVTLTGGATDVAWDSTGAFLLAATPGGIRVLRVNPDNTVNEVTGQPSTTAVTSLAVAGGNVYANGSGTITAFGFNTTTGLLTQIAQTSAPAGPIVAIAR